MGNSHQKPSDVTLITHRTTVPSSEQNAASLDYNTCLLKFFEKLELTADEGNVYPGVLSRKAFENTFHGPLKLFGKILYTQMQDGHVEKDLITKEQFVKAGKEILNLHEVNDQKKYYFRLFALGKDVLTKDDSRDLVVVCYALALSLSSIPYSQFANSEGCLEAMVNSMFGIQESISYEDFERWMEKHCPHLFSSVHEWVLCILTGSKSHTEEVTTAVPELDHILKGHYLINKTVLWCMTISLPGVYITIPKPTDLRTQPSAYAFVSSSVQDLLQKARLPHCQTWNLLYNSNDHGLSMNRFSHHVSSYKGSCVTLLSFEAKNLYCIASDCGWREGSRRYGNDQCLLIQLLPIYRVMQAGPNMLLWNEHNREMKKGIQIGRDAKSLILEIPSEFDSIKHYGVTCKLHRVEVWGCGGPGALEAQIKQKQWEIKDTQKHRTKKFTLHQKSESWEDNPDKQLLEWGGISTNHSYR
ncbi:uncharacterized protein LOC106870288 isoform X1 [Octopus bimaculoides]|uniref:TLDc domain-containing protein n=2 Tax=Octopus bimaculoides TaxID=37653 RepID=A0A0L8HJM6_OCTBM|nr:uncharacterized protein LOC106870288 isoform X1 [Octopus bimaculoides]|eukprot:XP_014771795.1 PREDICTED: uncharacterized protein LOC106870288 isoform X1 [Octopus bimaculoides]